MCWADAMSLSYLAWRLRDFALNTPALGHPESRLVSRVPANYNRAALAATECRWISRESDETASCPNCPRLTSVT